MFDVIVAAIVLVLTFPLFLLAGLAILLDSGLPIFFRQTRGGAQARPFQVLKFRTMVRDAEARLPELVRFDELADPMFKLKADPRVTRVGRVLRRTSIDELPQLINVLRGDMSIVGPRPEQLDLVERYAPGHQFRLEVKPGITGPMQIYGRGELTFDERLAVEREYVENLSLARDIRIVLMTLPAVFGKTGGVLGRVRLPRRTTPGCSSSASPPSSRSRSISGWRSPNTRARSTSRRRSLRGLLTDATLTPVAHGREAEFDVP